jgi:hypothetical protein
MLFVVASIEKRSTIPATSNFTALRNHFNLEEDNETLSIGNNVWNACMLFRVAISVCPRINPLGVGLGKHFWNQPWNPAVHSLAFE